MHRLDRTKAIISVVEAAARDGLLSDPTQSFLAQYLAVVMYSEMEERVSEIVTSHLSKHTNPTVATFISRSMAELIRRTPKSDIAKLIQRFGDDFIKSFNEAVDERKVTLYGNVISARHNIGHRHGSNITLLDIREGHDAANHILETLSNCLESP
ncbi:MAG: hypothetical protein INF50_01360 [Rhodobacter sp.]|nr:hypothetical protein [Rhodobacter sp.]